MKYKDFLKTILFKDADIIIIQNKNSEILDIKNYNKIRNVEILEYNTDIDNDLFIVTLIIDLEKEIKLWNTHISEYQQ